MPELNLDLDRHGDVAELTLGRNALNTLSRELLDDLTAALDEVAGDEEVAAVVLGSSAPKFFSAGWDLPALLPLSRAAFLEFYRTFSDLTVQLATLPKPTVAALGGFTVAGGCILALACDFRVMAAGRCRIGLNEVDLGLPMPLPAALLARGIGGGRSLRDLLVFGRLFTPDEALQSGIVDRVVEPSRVGAEARGLAAELAAKPAGSAGAMKRIVQAGFVEAVERGRAEDEARFAEAFFRPKVRTLLQAAAEKLVPR